MGRARLLAIVAAPLLACTACGSTTHGPTTTTAPPPTTTAAPPTTTAAPPTTTAAPPPTTTSQTGTPTPPSTTVSLQQVHGNAAIWHLYGITISDGRNATVNLNARTVTRTARGSKAVLVLATGTQTLTGAEQRQLASALARTDPRTFATSAACHGLPLGDVGGVRLTVGSATTRCPPNSAQPLVIWLERLAQQVPLKVTRRLTLTTP